MSAIVEVIGSEPPPKTQATCMVGQMLKCVGGGISLGAEHRDWALLE